jgi:hypothetical protein
MLKLVVVGIVATLASALPTHPVNENIINEIKSKATTW